jgi:hypothetical protein
LESHSYSLFSSNNRVTPLIQQAQEMESRLMPKARDAGEEEEESRKDNA